MDDRFPAMEVAILPLSEHRKDVGARLRRIIDLLGLRYVQAAEIMGVTAGVLNNWMTGDAYPQAYGLYRLCRARNVTTDWVYLGDWSQLPHHLAAPIEEEVLGKLAEALPAEPPEPAPKLVATSRQRTAKKTA